MNIFSARTRWSGGARNTADGWLAGTILHVTRLLAYDHHMRGAGPFAENRLCADLEQVASLATFGRGSELGESWSRRDEVSGGADWLRCFSRLRHVAHGPLQGDDVLGSVGRTRRSRSDLGALPRTLHF